MSLVKYNGSYVTLNHSFIKADVPGLEVVYDGTGTATNVLLSKVGTAKLSEYTTELVTYGYKQSDLDTSRIMMLTGDEAGTIKFHIAKPFVDPDAPALLLQRNNDGTWSELYNGKTSETVLPENGNFVVTVTKFGPICCMPADDYLVSNDGKVLYNSQNQYLAATEENVEAINKALKKAAKKSSKK